MPIYTYALINEDGSEGDRFEIEQSTTDRPLAMHPISKKPVRRIFSAPTLTIQYSAAEIKRKTGDKSYLESQGFARYERDSGTGLYHKTAGADPNAPDIIDPKKNGS